MTGFRVLFCATALALPLAAQTPAAVRMETKVFRAVLSPENEVPPIAGLAASGTGTMYVHIARGADGAIVGGSVDFITRYQFPGEVTFTGMHIHSGAAGINGPIVIDSRMPRTEDTAGRGTLRYAGVVPRGEARGLAALEGILNNPAGYYLNVHTSVNPGGAIRGQLVPAQSTVLLSLMTPGNEVPPITGLNASGVGMAHLLTTSSADGTLTSAEVIFEVSYSGFPEGTNFTGFHIHSGVAGTNGPVVIDSRLTGPLAAGANGAGTLRYEVEVAMTDVRGVAAVYGVLGNPAGYYMNLHTQVNPGGAIRGQMRSTDRAAFSVPLLSSNEVPPIADAPGTAAGLFEVYTVRDDEGNVQGAMSAFGAYYDFRAPVQFTGFHVHDAVAGVNGPVTVDSGLSRTNYPLSETGVGAVYRTVVQSRAQALTSITRLLRSPENHYLNLHTTDNPGGAVRNQLGTRAPAPQLLDVLGPVSDGSLRRVAPLGLITLFGSNLFAATGDANSTPAYAPYELNGTFVIIGDKWAPVVTLGREPGFVPTDYVVAQVAADTPTGRQPVRLATPTGESNTVMIEVLPQAPAIYFDEQGGIAFHGNGQLVRPGNPAAAGAELFLLASGLGLTRPGLGTGQKVPGDTNYNAAVMPTLNVGGQNVPVTSARAVPGMVGLYLVGFTAPRGVSGNVEVILQSGETMSNRVSLPMR